MDQKKQFSIFIALLVHISTSSLLALGMATLWGQLTPLISALGLTLGTALGLAAGKISANDSVDFRGGTWSNGIDGWIEKLFFAVIFVFALRHFYLLFYFQDGYWHTLNYHNLGDLPLHINYIRAMSEGNAFPLANPSFAEELLRYPYGMDLYNALWDSVGVPLTLHFFIVGIAATALSLIALRTFGSWWALVGFFLSGGWLGWWFYGYSRELMQDTAWKNLFLTVFVTQRGFLFALPAGLWLLHQISNQGRFDKTSSRIFGLLWGSLAFFHIHSFVALSLCIAFFTLKNRQVFEGVKAFTIAGPLGILFVLFSTDSFRQAGVMRLSSGWTYKGSESFLEYLNFNFGPYLYLYILLAALVAWRSFHKKDLSKAADFILYSALFVTFFMVILAPYDWDNVKVLIWPYLGLISVAHFYLHRLLPTWGKVLGVMVFSFSGFAIITPTIFSDRDAQALYSQEKITAAEHALSNLPRDAIFLADGDYAHVLTYLGRLRSAGYEGHLFSHGINYLHQKELMTAIENSFAPDSLELLPNTGANYIFVGEKEKVRFAHKLSPWSEELSNMSKEPSIQILEIKRPSK